MVVSGVGRLVGLLAGALCMVALPACAGPDAGFCDITRSDCQEDVFYTLLDVRGDGWNPWTQLPEVEVITRTSFQEQVFDEVERREQDVEPRPWDRALQLLGMLEPSTSSVRASAEQRVARTVAFYSSGQQGVTIIAGESTDDFVFETTTLAHEFVHALQDRERGLGPPARDTDGVFAGRALNEGEAVLYENLVRLRFEGRDPRTAGWPEFYAGWRDNLRLTTLTSSFPFSVATSSLAYPLGGAYLTRAWLAGGNAEVLRTTLDAPAAAVDYMRGHPHGDRHGSPLPCAPPEPPEGWSLFGSDVFGAAGLFAFIGPKLAEGCAHGELECLAPFDQRAWDHALDWEADRIWVFSREEDSALRVVWRVRFDDPGPARRVTNGLADHPQTLQRVGRDMLITASDGDVDLSAWPDLEACTTGG